MSEVKTQEFRQASARVLANAKLQSFMSRSMGTFDGARAEAIEELSPQRWEELREQGREIKRHTLDNLDYYLELLRERVIANGGHVHFAKDADEARAIVGRIAQTRGLKLAIKSKSMVFGGDGPESLPGGHGRGAGGDGSGGIHHPAGQ